MTGHLVLTTFHTNDAPSAISRLMFMGLERYLLASTLNMVIAQRLVRKVCPKCAEPVELEEQLLKRFGIDEKTAAKATFCQGAGCHHCGQSGYSGRTAIFEFLPVDNEVRQMLVDNSSEAQIRSKARGKGFGSLLDSGIVRLLNGETTAEELLRVTFSEEIED